MHIIEVVIEGRAGRVAVIKCTRGGRVAVVLADGTFKADATDEDSLGNAAAVLQMHLDGRVGGAGDIADYLRVIRLVADMKRRRRTLPDITTCRGPRRTCRE